MEERQQFYKIKQTFFKTNLFTSDFEKLVLCLTFLFSSVKWVNTYLKKLED